MENSSKNLCFALVSAMVAIPVWAQEIEAISELPDTLANRIVLDEVEVQSSAMLSKSDRKLLVPTAEQVALATNAVDLLQRLQIPRIVVDPVNDAVKMSGDGVLSIRINGRESTINDLKGIDPRNIKRVEYHDNPSLRYGEVDAVIDFIVRQPDSGGSFHVEGNQAYIAWGNYYANLKLNCRSSQFGISGWYNERNNFNAWRENTEYYKTANGETFSRKEEGLPGNMNVPSYGVYFDYIYTPSEKMQLFAQASLLGFPDQRYEYNGILSNSYSDVRQRVSDVNSQTSLRPNLNMYWQYNLSGNQQLTMDFVAGYETKDSERRYGVETWMDEWIPASSILTQIESENYSLIANANYEKSWNVGRLTAGLRYTQTWGENRYITSFSSENTRMFDMEAYAMWWQPLGSKFDYTIGLSGKGRIFRIEGGEETRSFTLHPIVRLRYKIDARHTLRLNTWLSTSTPNATDLSRVVQDVDEFQKYCGNPGLKPYNLYVGELQYEFNVPRFYGSLTATYRYNDKPIMEEKRWQTAADGTDFLLNTVDNQRFHSTAKLYAYAKVDIVPSWVSTGISAGWKYTVSRGHLYEHRFNGVAADWNVVLTHWNFTLMYEGQMNSRSLWGETIQGEENFHNVLLQYKYKELNVGIGIINPFFKNYNVPSENKNEYAGYDRKSHLKMAQNLVFVTFSYNIQWGRRQSGIDKKLNNSYEGGTVNTTGK